LEISGFRIINKEIPVIKVKILAMIDNEKSWKDDNKDIDFLALSWSMICLQYEIYPVLTSIRVDISGEPIDKLKV
jgi:hypothetical protein